ncbi:MAG: M56 family metallopeptidase, partial [Bacteroidaceae bacterium]|nr:M56 family metallopeptidase [Bacteroidaceae bacterium]
MLVFLLKASVCQLLFYAVYKLLLAKTTFHKANRCVILLAMAASVILAAADIRFESEHIPVGYANIAIDLISVNAVAMTEETPLSWLTVPNALALIYIIGVAVAMVRFAFPIAKLIRFVSRADKHRTADGYTLIVLDDDNMQSFSWFSYIVIPRKDYEEHGSEIICHEYAHVRLHHTETLMLMNLLCVVFWFNPIVWAMRNEMLLVDEFEADETVLQSGFEAKSYQHLLIRKSVEPSVYSLANGLSQKQLKKRIVMMKTKKSTMFAALRYGTLGAVVAAIIPAFASNTLVAPVEKVLHETITENVKAVMPFADTA